MTFQQARWDEDLLFEMRQHPPRTQPGAVEAPFPKELLRQDLDLPDLREAHVVRHFTRLSQMNFGIDTAFYPLGSCTMKYNPKYAEQLARLPGAQRMHPAMDPALAQGCLQIMFELQEQLRVISGMDAVSLQPAAGAQGEFTGLLIAKAYHRDRGEHRDEVILPDHAHGTNFSSAAMAGYRVVEIPSRDGMVDREVLEAALSPRTAAFMLTNPNTLGIFEPHVLELARTVHRAGALLYYDGANFNAILGKTNPGLMEFDIVHFNLHKTFATPHGGGGPGAGPVGVRKALEPYLPVPLVAQGSHGYYLEWDRPKSIGKVRGYHGSFGVLLRAYANILRWGSDGMAWRSERAVLNSNYLMDCLRGVLEAPFPGVRKHEFVVSAKALRAAKGVRALDVAKALMDYGFHPPTIYFPALVEEAIMIEPTESESKESLDEFADAVKDILRRPAEEVHGAPQHTVVGRVDEVQAARTPILSWRMLRRQGPGARIPRAEAQAARATPGGP